MRLEFLSPSSRCESQVFLKAFSSGMLFVAARWEGGEGAVPI